MRRLFVITLLICASAVAQEDPAARLLYDDTTPLRLEASASEQHGDAFVQQLSYASPKGGRVPATLVSTSCNRAAPFAIASHTWD